MVLTLASQAKFRAGFAHHRFSFLYSAKIPTAQEILRVNRPVHTAEHLASAMFWLGVPENGDSAREVNRRGAARPSFLRCDPRFRFFARKNVASRPVYRRRAPSQR